MQRSLAGARIPFFMFAKPRTVVPPAADFTTVKTSAAAVSSFVEGFGDRTVSSAPSVRSRVGAQRLRSAASGVCLRIKRKT